MKSYDIVIIGAGSAGLAAREEIATATSKYLVIDRGPLGTTCARSGCMPSKVLIEAAAAASGSAKLRKIGAVTFSQTLDRKAIMRHVRVLRDRFVQGVLSEMEEWRETHFRSGEARISGPHEIEIGGEKIGAEKIIVAAGTSPVFPADWARSGAPLLTTDAFFELENLPDRIGVVGFGPIGLEIAQALARLGMNVSLFGESGKFGGLTDPDLVSEAKSFLRKEVSLVEGRVESVSAWNGGASLRVKGRSYDCDLVLLAMGRRADLGKLGLQNAGLEWDERGRPNLTESYQIPGREIYVVGDLNRHRPLLHEAVDQGRIAGAHAVHGHAKHYRERTPLAITFSSPQIARVGRSFRELTEEGCDFAIGQVRFDRQGRALAKMENAGLIRVYGDRANGALLGAELFGPGAEHLAHLLAWSMQAGQSVFQMLGNPFYHPTVEEGLRTALRDLSKKVEGKPPESEDFRCREPVAGAFSPRGTAD